MVAPVAAAEMNGGGRAEPCSLWFAHTVAEATRLSGSALVPLLTRRLGKDVWVQGLWAGLSDWHTRRR